nr:AraC family transcriptional regulator [Cohnella sp. WQ 127256]
MKTIRLKGFDWDAFCSYASIDTGLLMNPDARIAEDEFERIVTAASLFTGDDAFGLHQGQKMNVSDLGVLGYVMQHSKTIGEALAAYQKYNVIVCSGFNADVEAQGDDVVIRLFFTHPSQAANRHCMEDMTASFYQTMLGLGCRPIAVKEIRFIHSQSIEVEEYVSAFGVVPMFGQDSNTIRMSKAVLDYPVLSADARLLGVFEAIAEEVRAKLTEGSVVSGELSRWIIDGMARRFPTLQEAAKEMRMSVRTLQAKLQQENTSYNRLANEVRKELALWYLIRPEYSIGDIAYFLHFSEPSAFQKAFRKWTGITPGEYRQRRKNDKIEEDTPSSLYYPS